MLVNAVFEGGGVKGICLAGAIQAAEQNGCQFNRIAGTSSGAIVASLLAAQYTAAEIREIVAQTNYSAFLKRARIFNTKIVGPAARVLIKKGLYSGEALEGWIKELLRKKGIHTFADLPQGKLSIIASDITNGKILVLPDDVYKLGIDPMKLSVAKAVRMSTSIPYFFDPVILRLNGEAARGKKFADQFIYVVDGALLSNFPLWLFDQERPDAIDPPTIGFQMVGKAAGKPHIIRGPVSMLQAMVETMLTAHDQRHISQDIIDRTIKIPSLGVSATQFEISPEDTLRLYESGYKAGMKFFNNWRKLPNKKNA